MSLLGAIAGPLIGGVAGFLGSRSQADAIEEAAGMSAIPTLWPEAYPYAQDIMGEAQRFYDLGMYAPQATPLELLGRANTLGYAEESLPGMIGAAQSSWLRGLDPGFNPYVGPMVEAAQRDVLRNYQENVLPSIRQGSQAAGGYGSLRSALAEGIASRDLMDTLGDISVGILGPAYSEALGQQRAAWQQAPSLTGMGFLPSQYQMDIGQMYGQDLMNPVQNLQGYMGAMSPFWQFSGGAQVMPAPNPWGSALQGAGIGQSLLGNIFSQPQTNVNIAGNMGAGSGMGIPSSYTGGFF